MKRNLIAILGLILLAAVSRVSAAEGETNSNPQLNRNYFQIISDRNIFDPNRRPQRPQNNGPRSYREYFTLKGAMTYENQGYAFFDGNGTQTNRGQAYQPNQTINGYAIVEITNNSVKLSDAGNHALMMVVGMQMSRDVTSDPARGDTRGPWKPVAGTAVSSDSDASGSSGQAGEGGSGDSAGGAESDVMKKLIERRLAEEKASAGNGGTNDIHE
jgi:hypothetical protein